MAEAHPQHNFTSNFNGSDGHNAQLKLFINGVEHMYTPAGNDKVFNVPGVARIPTNLAAAELITDIRTALDGDAFPVLVEPIPDSESEVVYQYVGQTEDNWAFSLATVNFIITVWVNIQTGIITRNTISMAGMSAVVYIDYAAANLYTRIAGAIAAGQTPVIKRTVANQTTYYWPVNNTAYQEPVGDEIDHRANNGYYFIGKETTFESGTDTPINDVKMLWVRPDSSKNVSGIPQSLTPREEYSDLYGIGLKTNSLGQVTEITYGTQQSATIDTGIGGTSHVLTAEEIAQGYYDIHIGLPSLVVRGKSIVPDSMLITDCEVLTCISHARYDGNMEYSVNKVEVLHDSIDPDNPYYAAYVCRVDDFTKDEFGRLIPNDFIEDNCNDYRYNFLRTPFRRVANQYIRGFIVRNYINTNYAIDLPIVPGTIWPGPHADITVSAKANPMESIVVNLPVVSNANTLRFRFSDPSYSPVTAEVGSSGTWTKRKEFTDNIWDWTNNSSNWLSAFYNAWTSDDMEVELVAAGDTSSVTGVSRLFVYCSALKSAIAFDTSNAADFSEMFAGCTSLEEVPYFETDSATNVNSMFEGCTNVRAGALSLYTRMSGQATPPDFYGGAFVDCGKDTTEGYAELLQIPASWGGLAP